MKLSTVIKTLIGAIGYYLIIHYSNMQTAAGVCLVLIGLKFQK